MWTAAAPQAANTVCQPWGRDTLASRASRVSLWWPTDPNGLLMPSCWTVRRTWSNVEDWIIIIRSVGFQWHSEVNFTCCRRQNMWHHMCRRGLIVHPCNENKNHSILIKRQNCWSLDLLSGWERFHGCSTICCAEKLLCCSSQGQQSTICFLLRLCSQAFVFLRDFTHRGRQSCVRMQGAV